MNQKLIKNWPIYENNRTGLKKYKTTLGTQPKKRGPKPKNPFEGLKQTEL
jgi:hypothetical protein